jgi:uncharacterized protein
MGRSYRQAFYCFDSFPRGGYYSPPMSAKTLPEYLDLRRLAEQEAVVVGQMPNRAMYRLLDSLADDNGQTEAELCFALDPIRRPTIRGWARTELALVCQRCLEVYRQPLNVEFNLVRVRGEAEAEQLPDGVEPLLLSDEEQLRTAELLEDELILALPIVAAHADEKDCRIDAGEQSAAGEAADQQKTNPFAALAALKRKQD